MMILQILICLYKTQANLYIKYSIKILMKDLLSDNLINEILLRTRWSKCWFERRSCRVTWSNTWIRWKSKFWSRWRGATTVRCGITWSKMNCRFRPARRYLYQASSTHPLLLRLPLRRMPSPDQIHYRSRSLTPRRHTCPTGVRIRVSLHVNTQSTNSL